MSGGGPAAQRGGSASDSRGLLRLPVLLACAVLGLGAAAVFVVRPWAPPPGPAPPEIDLTRLDRDVASHLREVRAAVLGDPRSESAWGRLGAVCEVHGLYLEAESCYERAAELDPGDWRWPYFLGMCLRRRDQEAAAESFLRALELKPEHVPLIAHGADSLRRIGRDRAAEQLYRKALRLDEDCAPAFCGLGALALRRGDFDEAARTLRRAVELEPGYKQAHQLLAQVYRRKGRTDSAQEQERIAEECSPEMPLSDTVRDALWWHEGVNLKWRSLRAAQYRKAGRYEDAVAEWEAALQNHPESARIHAELAAVLVLAGRSQEAAKHRRHALELAPEPARVHFLMGVAFAEAGDESRAVAAFRSVLEDQPEHLRARQNLGSLLARSGRLREAIPHLRAVARERPDDPTALDILASALADAGRFSQSAEVLERLARVRPQDPRVYDRWATALTRSRRHARAIEVLRNALENMPDNATTANRLAWLLAAGPEASSRNGEEALALAHELCEGTGYADPVLLDTLAAAQAETGDFEGAVDTMKRAMKLAEQRMQRGDFNPALLDRMRGRLELYYMRSRPYHGPP